MCTGITLRAEDGSVIYGRTLEWGAFDLHSRLLLVPSGLEFTGESPEGLNGRKWTTRFAVGGLDMLERVTFADAINEKGLAVGLFYHPGFAEYAEYDSDIASRAIAPTDVVLFLLSTCATTSEVREALDEITVVNVIEDTLGVPAPIHLIVTDPSGDQIVIEWHKGECRVFESELGVLTNAPTYDWHMVNLRNYVNLSPVALPGVQIKDLDFQPLGGGSGMIGLPGDFTPPSRFVRAVAFTATARPTSDGSETIYEMFRILDSFNVPPSAAEGPEHLGRDDLRSSTLWTTAHDLSRRVIYYHTMHNRQVRKFDFGSLDVEKATESMIWPLDREKSQSIEDRTPSL